MRFTLLFTISALVLLGASCADEKSLSYRDKEQAALDAWIEKYVPDALKLGDTGIYYEIISQENLGETIKGGNWLEMDYTLKDLSGNVIYNRDEAMARRQGQFTPYTYYSSDFLYMTDDVDALAYMQGFFWNLEEMKVNEVRRFYIPSHYGYGSNEFSNTVGYGGQYSLGANRPLIIDNAQVHEVIADPEAREQEMLMQFVEQHWGIDRANSVAERPHMYIRYLKSGTDTIPVDSTANIYYTGRFLDDFVFDTNIDTMWVNTFGKLRTNDPVSAIKIKYTKDDDGEPTIGSSMPEMTFTYMLKQLHYGDSLQVAVASKYAYAQNGRSGSRNSSTSTSYDYYDPYYSYYGSGYGSGYGGYGYGYDDYSTYMLYMMSSSYGSSSSSGTTDTITEVKAYTPVVYTLVVKDPNEEED